jgi:hypothetical protein
LTATQDKFVEGEGTIIELSGVRQCDAVGEIQKSLF